VSEAKTNLSRYFDFYNTRPPHSGVDGRTPDEFYFASLPPTRKAA
jgi:putative transposase